MKSFGKKENVQTETNQWMDEHGDRQRDNIGNIANAKN